MSKTSVIVHPAKNHMVIVRASYVAICEFEHPEHGTSPDPACCAAILNTMEYWQNIKIEHASQVAIENEIKARGSEPAQDNELWIYKTQDEFKSELFSIWGTNKVASCLKWLVNVGYIHTRTNPKFGWDRTSQYQLNIHLVQMAISTELKNAIFKIKDSKAQNQRLEGDKIKDAIPQSPSQTTSQPLDETDDFKDSTETTIHELYVQATGHTINLVMVQNLNDLVQDYGESAVRKAILSSGHKLSMGKLSSMLKRSAPADGETLSIYHQLLKAFNVLDTDQTSESRQIYLDAANELRGVDLAAGGGTVQGLYSFVLSKGFSTFNAKTLTKYVPDYLAYSRAELAKRKRIESQQYQPDDEPELTAEQRAEMLRNLKGNRNG